MLNHTTVPGVIFLKEITSFSPLLNGYNRKLNEPNKLVTSC